MFSTTTFCVRELFLEDRLPGEASVFFRELGLLLAALLPVAALGLPFLGGGEPSTEMGGGAPGSLYLALVPVGRLEMQPIRTISP